MTSIYKSFQSLSSLAEHNKRTRQLRTFQVQGDVFLGFGKTYGICSFNNEPLIENISDSELVELAARKAIEPVEAIFTLSSRNDKLVKEYLRRRAYANTKKRKPTSNLED
jgi:hypothetical protein